MLSGVYWWRRPATLMGVILLRRRHLRIPTSLGNERAFINIKFSENVPVALAGATIEFDFVFSTTILVKGKPMKKAAVVSSAAAIMARRINCRCPYRRSSF